jgi:endonuclease YncB( thermonuclease family)
MGVRRVIDGDTLVLADGRHVRFIGINAMELGHDGGTDQPYAATARARLKQLIKDHGGKLNLESGAEAYDERGRTLAYLFAGGDDLGADLIREGLAVLVAVPPDLARLDCYAEAEAQARAAHLGIWSKDSPLITDGTKADLTPGAFLIIEGIVSEMSQVRAGVHLVLDGRLRVWVPTNDLGRFTSDPVDLKGRKVLVRGWVRDYKGTPELEIHAPQALLPLP